MQSLDDALVWLQAADDALQACDLSLREANIGDDGACRLSEALRSLPQRASALMAMNLSHNSLSIHGLNQLLDSNVLGSACPVLQELNLGFNSLGDAGADKLASAISTGSTGALPNLEKLCLAFNLLTPVGAKHLSTALSSTSCGLRYLDLSDNAVGADGAAHLADALVIQHQRKDGQEASKHYLEELCLSNAEIGSAGAASLAKALLQGSLLSSLSLQDNNIGPDGAKHLSSALKTDIALMRSLNLWHNSLLDEGVEHLAESLHENSSLEVLNLGFNDLSDEAVEGLSQALEGCGQVSRLREINLEFNEISEEAAERLESALASCKRD